MGVKEIVQIGLIKKKWTQRKLAKEMNISNSYLNDILNGNRKPAGRLKEIEHLISVDLSDFY